MPRPSQDKLATVGPADMLALIDPVADRLIVLFERMVRVASSEELRRAIMAAASFPFDDVKSFLAINQLALHGALRPTELARRLETGRPNATKIMQRLEDAGLVVRAASDEDGRGVVVALTPAGRVLGGRIVDAERVMIKQRLSDWSHDDIALVGRLLGQAVGSG